MAATRAHKKVDGRVRMLAPLRAAVMVEQRVVTTEQHSVVYWVASTAEWKAGKKAPSSVLKRVGSTAVSLAVQMAV